MGGGGPRPKRLEHFRFLGALPLRQFSWRLAGDAGTPMRLGIGPQRKPMRRWRGAVVEGRELG